MSEQLTVEEALKELREMFPSKCLFIRRDTEFYPADENDHRTETTEITTIKVGILAADPKFTEYSLEQAIAKVRAWKESQSKEQ